MEPTNNFAPQVPPQEPVMPPPAAPPVVPPPAPVTPIPPPPSAPTPSAPPSPSGDNSWKTFSLILLGLIIIGSGAFAFIQYRAQDVPASETGEAGEEFYPWGNENEVVDDVRAVVGSEAQWTLLGKTYTNYEHNFSIELPVGWEPDVNNPTWFLSPSSLQDVGTRPGPILDIAFFVASGAPGREIVTQGGSPRPSITDVKKKVINGREFTTYRDSDSFDRGAYGYQVTHNGATYAFHTFTPQHIPILEQMLSTLKFTS